MSEMRTMSSSTATATKGKGKAGAGEDGEATPKKGKKKILILAVVALLVLGGAAYWFLLKPSKADAAPEKKPAPVAGAVTTVDPISINLADGHYLKIGIGLQQEKSVSEAVDTSKALDTMIELYSGKPMSELSDPHGNAVVKKELVKEISEKYEDEVYDVYFTQFVMQ